MKDNNIIDSLTHIDFFVNIHMIYDLEICESISTQQLESYCHHTLPILIIIFQFVQKCKESSLHITSFHVS